MISEEGFDNLINDAINDLAGDNITDGVESLIELADIFAKAGMPQQTFYDIRQHIIKEATARTDAVFIREKLVAAEKEHKRLGNGDLIITSIHTH